MAINGHSHASWSTSSLLLLSLIIIPGRIGREEHRGAEVRQSR